MAEKEATEALVLAQEADDLNWRTLMKGSVLEELLDLDIDLKKVGVKEPVAEDEDVIGTLNDFELHMRALSLKYSRMAHLVNIKAHYDAESKEEEETLAVQADTLKDIGKACMSLVWENARMRLNVGAGYGVGVRDGLKIVRMTRQSSGSPFESLGRLLGKKLGGHVEIVGPIGPEDD
jgi:hypothetical protein